MAHLQKSKKKFKKNNMINNKHHNYEIVKQKKSIKRQRYQKIQELIKIKINKKQ